MIRRVLSLNGRASPDEWWAVTIVAGLAKTCLLFAVVPLLSADSAGWQWRMWSVLAVIDLALFWPLVAVNVRRAHDRGKTGLLEGGLVLVALLAGLAVDQTPWSEEAMGVVATLLRGLVYGPWVVLLCLQGLTPGVEGDNRYGPLARPLAGPAS